VCNNILHGVVRFSVLLPNKNNGMDNIRTLFHLCLPLDFFGQDGYDKPKVKLCKLFFYKECIFFEKSKRGKFMPFPIEECIK
jgi:hypothetical protein